MFCCAKLPARQGLRLRAQGRSARVAGTSDPGSPRPVKPDRRFDVDLYSTLHLKRLKEDHPMLSRKGLVLLVSLALASVLAVGFPSKSRTAEVSRPLGPSAALPGPALPRPALPRPASRRSDHPQQAAATSRPDGDTPDESADNGLSLNVARRNHTATALPDGRVIIIGGDNLEGAVREAEILDPSSHTVLVLSI